MGTHDSAAPPTSCGNPVETTADSTVNLGGSVDDSALGSNGNAVVGGTVTAFSAGDASLGSAPTENGGVYALDATTGGKPVEYLTLQASGYTTMRLYPHAPITASTTVAKIGMFTSTDVSDLATTAGVTPASGKAIAVITVTDCNSTSVPGATITAPGSAVVKYFHADGSANGTSTDSTGTAVVFNLAPGTVMLAAQASGLMFYSRAVKVDSSYLTVDDIAEK
jgi:hypothetical protein